jgi:rhodanese-related sulfurtransferase
MGWDARVLTAAPLVTGPPPATAVTLPGVEWVTVAELTDDGGPVVDVSTSTTYARGHVPGAVWATRRDLVEADELDGAVVVSEDGGVAAFAAAEAAARRGVRRRVLAGGTAAWREAGRDLTAAGATWWSTPSDVYVRPYVGTSVDRAVMQAYLDWEHGLVAQLERDGTHRFRVLGGR